MDYTLTSVEVEGEELTVVQFPALGAPHGSSTRLGGVSQGAFESLNLGYTAGDETTAVDVNRDRFARALGFEAVPWTLSMVHGTEVAVLDEPLAGRPRADACITDRPGIPMSITTADCVPIIFHDPVRRAVGLAHAGWRGTVGGIARSTVEAMTAHYGTRPADLRVALAPAIGPDAFLVDADVAEPFEHRFAGQDLVVKRTNKWAINLWEANRQVLRQSGVPSEQIFACELCTFERPDLFFSYRREKGRTGRLLTAVTL